MSIASIKSACVYESVIDTMRSLDDVPPIFADIGCEYIHRSFFRWMGMAKIEQDYDVYGMLKQQVISIKSKSPSIVIGGAVTTQEINVIEYNPLTKTIISKEETWGMALDPQKYGFSMTKEELYNEYVTITGNADYIFPDILNLDYQDLFMSYVKMQIDAGIESIWIDGFYTQAAIFYMLSGKDITHPAVQSVFISQNVLIDKIHEYNNNVTVGSWGGGLFLDISSWTAPNLDFVTSSPDPDEISNMVPNDILWKEKVNKIYLKFGTVPIFAFIDWGFTTDTQLGIFSQELRAFEQSNFLIKLNKVLIDNGIVFAYPVHGGYMGAGAAVRAYGIYNKYDSLAPEFNTYNVIKELSLYGTSELQPQPTDNNMWVWVIGLGIAAIAATVLLKER